MPGGGRGRGGRFRELGDESKLFRNHAAHHPIDHNPKFCAGKQLEALFVVEDLVDLRNRLVQHLFDVLPLA